MTLSRDVLRVAMAVLVVLMIVVVAVAMLVVVVLMVVAMSNYTSSDVFARGNEQLYVELQKLDCVFADELAVVLLADSSVFDHFV